MDLAVRHLQVEARGRFYLQIVRHEKMSSKLPRSYSGYTCAIDSSGTVTGWTKSAESLFGHTESEAIGQNFHRLWDSSGSFIRNFEHQLAAAYEQGKAIGVFHFNVKGGNRRFRGKLIVKPIWKHGEFGGYFVSIERLAQTELNATVITNRIELLDGTPPDRLAPQDFVGV
jgi:PAS domain-containing protein